MENRAFGALATALLLCSASPSAARAEQLRVLYAEPFQAQSQSTPGAQKSGPAHLRVQAFNRTFELELEDNSRLLRATSAATRGRFGTVRLLKGTIKDAPGSWVRLTLRDGRYSGAFWDGSELYAVASREELDSALLTPMAAGATGIYRLSDTQGGLFDGTCGVAGSAAPSASPIAKFRSLIGELRAAADTAFATAPREIEISMIGDVEFSSRFGSGARQAMLDRMNVVDGIFSSQVGVATVPTDFITFDTNPDPFTSSEPSTLLEELGTYRNATPTVRSRGLAHLLTGRQLDGDIVGIAYLGSVCTSRTGAGLTEISSFIDSPLVMAHEIGHNFGAPHDAETGSPCASTPPNFLMAPQINFTSEFSACSLQQIQNRIQTASCIVAARNRDLAVSVPADTLQAVIGVPFDYFVDVTSLGDSPVLNAVLTVTMSGGASVLSMSMPDAACEERFGVVRCELPSLAPAQTRRLTLRLALPQSGNFVFDNAVTSSSDANSSNDSHAIVIHVAREAELALKVTPQPLTVASGETFELTYEVTASGIAPLNDMRAEIVTVQAEATSVTVDSGTCTLATIHNVTCQLGTIAAGTTRHIRVQWRSDVPIEVFGGIQAASTSDPSISSDTGFRVTVVAARDVTISPQAAFKRVAIGADALWSLEVRSQGANTADDVHVRIPNIADVAISVDPPLDASCTVVSDAIDCALGAMAPQATRTLVLRIRADVALSTNVLAQVVLPTPDDLPGNDFASLSLEVRIGDEVSMNVTVPPARDEQLAELFGAVLAFGANASENVTVRIALPAGFVAQSGTLGDQPCTFAPETPHLVTCSVARIESVSSAWLDLLYIAPQPGSYSGTIEVSADHDTDPSNNNLALTFEVLPNVDARLTAPAAPERARTDIPVDLVFVVGTNKYALPDTRLDFSWFGPFSEFSASAPGATCGTSAAGYSCEWPSLPANSSVQVAVRLRASERVSASLSAVLVSNAETDWSNNSVFLSFPIVVPGDVAVSVSQSTVTATEGQPFTMPGINVLVLTPVENAFIDLTFETGRLEQAGLADGSCSQIGVALRCVIFGMQAPGTYRLNLGGVPRGVGAVPIAIRVGAFNDFNTANDQQMVTLAIVEPQPPPPPPPPPPPSGGGGGGGGGSMDWLFAALLFLMWHHRRTHSRVYR